MKNLFKTAFMHSAGATVQHKGPFSSLDVPVTENALSQEFCLRWVTPFYMACPIDDIFPESYQKLRTEITEGLTNDLLAEFDWRPRIVGGYFVAIEEFAALETHIGNLLLRSDVCYAGYGYLVALTSLNTETSLQFLKQYLDYYLKKKKLWFDQADCMAAVAFLDQKNKTNVLQNYLPAWQKFVKNKPNWNLEESIQRFANNMNAVETLKHENS